MGPIFWGFWLFPIGPDFWILVWDRKKFGFPEPWCLYLVTHTVWGQPVAVPTIMRMDMEIAVWVKNSIKMDILCAISDFSMHCAHFMIQLTLVISTPLISILSLMSNWFLSPDYFPYVYIVFQLRVCRTTFMSTLRLSRPSFSVPEYIFHSFYYRVSRTRTMTKEKM